MRAAFKTRVRSSSISAVAPLPGSPDYSPDMAKAASSILYASPLPSPSGHPIYILNAAALPDTQEVDYDTLLPYVLARLPGEEDLIRGAEYEVIFFAGGNIEGATSARRNHPGVGWFIQAYHVLSRAMRKRIKKLYVVHERKWVRMLVEVFSTIASAKFRRKIVHASNLSQLAQHIDITSLLIPPSAYLRDRQISPNIHTAGSAGRRAFSARTPLPRNLDGTSRLPRVLRETTSFILLNLQTEGLFRIPAHMKLKEVLREAYDRGQKYIVWKEKEVSLPLPRYENTISQVDMDVLAKEMEPSEAYGVHLAASLLKFWYSELREPVFPSSSYKSLRKLYGDVEEPIVQDKLVELLSPKSDRSIIPATSREILTRHLLPLMAAIAAQSEENKMTPENLAVCFAPTLCCGPDQLEDAKTSSILRRVLTAAIEQWPGGLRDACGKDDATFAKDLQAPVRMEDYEDPLPAGSLYEDEKTDERPLSSDGFTEEQQVGIILQDNDTEKTDSIIPPPLPPRQPTHLTTHFAEVSGYQPSGPPLPPRSVPTAVTPVSPGPSSAGSETSIRRKEVPAVNTQLPPRYTTNLTPGDDFSESPSTYMTPANGFAPRHKGDWSFEMSEHESPIDATMVRQDSQLKRKPVGGTPTTEGKE